MSIEDIDEDYLPQVCHTGFDKTFCRLIKVPKKSSEYIFCQNMMAGDFVKNFIAVYRVENKYLTKKYKSKLANKRNRSNNVYELDLLHCTSKYNVRPIIEDNFDPEMATRVKFCRGVSFSPKAAYANLQSSVDNGVDRAMFVCKVMIGKKQIGETDAIPDFPYDTMVDRFRNGNVFVKYNDYEFRPNYVIFYESYPVVSYNGKRSLRKKM